MTARRGRYVLACALIIAIGVPSAAVGFGEGRFLKLGKRNPSPNGTLALNTETEIIASNGSYGTRQSNKRDGDGGGAIYGCRSNPGNEPCVRANNLKGGRAFEFATIGKEGGRIDVGDPSGAPFTTNATGVATGLNADRVDGREAADFATADDFRWAVVSAADAKVTASRGATGATVDAAKGTYVVTFNRDVRNCSYTVAAAGDEAKAEHAFAVKASTTDPKAVLVDQPDPATDRTDFHLQVVC